MTSDRVAGHRSVNTPTLDLGRFTCILASIPQDTPNKQQDQSRNEKAKEYAFFPLAQAFARRASHPKYVCSTQYAVVRSTRCIRNKNQELFFIQTLSKAHNGGLRGLV